MVHPAHVLLPPDVKVEVCKLLQLEGKPTKSQWGKSQRSSTHQPPQNASGELPALPLPARPPGKVYLDLSRQFPTQGLPRLNSQHRTHSRANRQHVDCASQELGMQRCPRCCGDTQAGRISYRHTDTHTARLLRLLGSLPHPRDLPGRNSHCQHPSGHGPPLSLSL